MASLVSSGGEEPKMSSRELSTAGCCGAVLGWVEVVVAIVAGDEGGDRAELESGSVDAMAWRFIRYSSSLVASSSLWLIVR